MLRVAIDSQRTLALQLYLTLAIDTSLPTLIGIGSIGERVDGTILGTDLDTFLVGDIDGRSRRIRQRHTCQRYRTLVRAIEGKLAIGGRS